MKCREIIEKIEKKYSPSAALDFDNVGLLAGNTEKEVKRIYLALDATTEVIQHAAEWKADMLLTHHPLIFTPLKRVTNEDFVGRRVMELIQNDISYYAMHTNYDVLGMAKLIEGVLGLKDARTLDVTTETEDPEEGIGKIGALSKEMRLRECCEYVKQCLHLDSVRVFGDLDISVKQMAVSPGSGKSAIRPALLKGADVLVTGDIGHHEGLDAWEQGLAIIDAGHYGTEYLFMEDMKQYLLSHTKDVEFMTEPMRVPFRMI